MATTNNGTADKKRGRLPPAVLEDILGSERRRALLEQLYEQGEAVPVEDLAAMLAAETGENDVTDSDRRAARTEIYQEHLPTLTATGVVHFDSLLGQVELADVPELTATLDGETASDEDGTKDK